MCANLLSAGRHEVLLGTLKKFEQKSATLTTVLVFALAFFLSVAYEDGEWGGYGSLAVLFASVMIAPTYFAFGAMRQLDTWDCRREIVPDSLTLPRFLQRSLIRDLIRKERAFWFAKASVQGGVIILLPVVVGEAWAELICSPG